MVAAMPEIQRIDSGVIPPTTYYCVIEFRYKAENVKHPFAIVPKSWVATFCEYGEQGPALVKYPEDQMNRVTRRQVEDCADYSKHWKIYLAYVHHTTDKYQDAKLVLRYKKKERKGALAMQASQNRATETSKEKDDTSATSAKKTKGTDDSSVGSAQKRKGRDISSVASTDKRKSGDDSSATPPKKRTMEMADKNTENHHYSTPSIDKREKKGDDSSTTLTAVEITGNKNEVIINSHIVIRLDRYTTDYVNKPIKLSKEKYDRMTTIARDIVRSKFTKN